MKLYNPFLTYLSQKYKFNIYNEWNIHIVQFKEKEDLNDIQVLIQEMSLISGYSSDEITGTCRKRNLVETKHIGRYIAHRNQLGSLSEIGKAFGNKDHSTVIHSINFVDSMLAINERLFMINFDKYKHLIL